MHSIQQRYVLITIGVFLLFLPLGEFSLGESSSTCIFACLTLTMLITLKIPIVYAIQNC